ncbi:MAG: amidinotransferase [Bacteroidetes bacterium]|nr:amidinotransferase [Bacteroidota bacterium]
MQNTSHVLMIRPVQFTFNAETAVNNSFQVAGHADDAQTNALNEFDAFVEKLRQQGIDVTVINDTPEPHTPDSIFPNNWISFHSNGTIILYPMYATNRRAERKQHILDAINNKFSITSRIDLTGFENKNLFLEGTGSMVLDRENKIAYACISPRTNKEVLETFCNEMHYTPCTFTATDDGGGEIYHTNVMMCMADQYVVICTGCIKDETECKHVVNTIQSSHKKMIDISTEQMNHFAGNMLQLQNDTGEKILVMSSQAFLSLSKEQVAILESYNRIVHSDLTSIETNGGGSARCMIAEIFLQPV